ncbi:hypothetical protein BDP27DRAFT_1407003 [Rhodocollybia butyracea]|uniref:Uncharacterized protein n=1 Tax=Rhodocollybia butyracea TaxID=206335 RepID=A0A9P5PCL1_9AGAR|nr:hypothetical protein BDP27DRAFT_1407003 [Rhodocollybia butyracea]
MKIIAEACSLDVEASTLEDLHSADPLIECVTCYSVESPWQSGRAFMRWPQAVCHPTHHVLIINSFGSETKQIVAKASEPGNLNLNCEVLCCSHCHQDIAVSDLRLHLMDSHRDVAHTGKLDQLTSTPHPRLFDRKDWYWNPCKSLDKLGELWRYNPPPPPELAAAEAQPAAAPTETNSDRLLVEESVQE